MEKDGRKGTLVVPIEVIPEQMSIEQFLGGVRNNDPVVMEIVEKHGYYKVFNSYLT